MATCSPSESRSAPPPSGRSPKTLESTRHPKRTKTTWATFPARPGRGSDRGRLLRHRDANRYPPVRPRGDRARYPPDPGPRRHTPSNLSLGDPCRPELGHGLEDTRCQIKYLIRDRDGKYPALFDTILADAGIEVVLSDVRMPRMNSIMERWIQACRHELLDRTLTFNQVHLLLRAVRRVGVSARRATASRRRPSAGKHRPGQGSLPRPVSCFDHRGDLWWSRSSGTGRTLSMI
jgi:hypothetical protein